MNTTQASRLNRICAAVCLGGALMAAPPWQAPRR